MDNRQDSSFKNFGYQTKGGDIYKQHMKTSLFSGIKQEEFSPPTPKQRRITISTVQKNTDSPLQREMITDIVSSDPLSSFGFLNDNLPDIFNIPISPSDFYLDESSDNVYYGVFRIYGENDNLANNDYEMIVDCVEENNVSKPKVENVTLQDIKDDPSIELCLKNDEIENTPSIYSNTDSGRLEFLGMQDDVFETVEDESPRESFDYSESLFVNGMSSLNGSENTIVSDVSSNRDILTSSSVAPLPQVIICSEKTSVEDNISDNESNPILVNIPEGVDVYNLIERRLHMNFDFENTVPKGQEFMPFEEIFEIAMLPKLKSGLSIGYVSEFISKFSNKNSSFEEKQKALIEHLNYKGVSVRAILADAVRKDKAIDTYEVFLNNIVEGRKMKYETEIDILEKKIEARKKAIIEDQEKLREWKKNKLELEVRLRDACSYLGNSEEMTVGLVSEGCVGREQDL